MPSVLVRCVGAMELQTTFTACCADCHAPHHAPLHPPLITSIMPTETTHRAKRSRTRPSPFANCHPQTSQASEQRAPPSTKQEDLPKTGSSTSAYNQPNSSSQTSVPLYSAMDATDVRPSKRARLSSRVGALAVWKQSLCTRNGVYPFEMDHNETDFRAYQRLALALVLRHHHIPDDCAHAFADYIILLYAQFEFWKTHRPYKDQYNLPVLFANLQALNPAAQRAVVRAHVFREDLHFSTCSLVIPRLTLADAQCFHPVVCTASDRRMRRRKPGEAPKYPCKRTWTDCAGVLSQRQWHCIECCLE